ncbi:hypothetical protein KL948_003781 [Ogataea haglerorum]|nr:hypothetical protein KL948_003781 [Ogataea haglerorum]KAG7736923.1 hypothetical protein KL923_004061 [Ogataea haglerorum]
MERGRVGLDAVEVAREGHHDAVDQQAPVDGELRGEMRQDVTVVQNQRERYPGDQQEAREKAAKVHHVARGAQLGVAQVRGVLGGVVLCDQYREVCNGKHESVQEREPVAVERAGEHDQQKSNGQHGRQPDDLRERVELYRHG